VVGVILVALTGVALLLRISRLPSQAQPYAAATFASFAIMVGLAWSMWQTWLLCASGLIFLYVRTAAASSERSQSHAEIVPERAAAPLGAGPIKVA
jgi:hypothetical protein